MPPNSTGGNGGDEDDDDNDNDDNDDDGDDHYISGKSPRCASTSGSDSEVNWADASDVMQLHVPLNDDGDSGSSSSSRHDTCARAIASSIAPASISVATMGTMDTDVSDGSDGSLPSTPHWDHGIKESTPGSLLVSGAVPATINTPPSAHHKNTKNSNGTDSATLADDVPPPIEAVQQQSLTMAVEATKILLRKDGKHSAHVLQYFDLLAGHFDKLGIRQYVKKTIPPVLL